MKIMPFTIRWVFFAVCMYFIFFETGWFTVIFLSAVAMFNEYFGFLLRKLGRGITSIDRNITFLTGMKLGELENQEVGGFLMRKDVSKELREALKKYKPKKH